MSEEEKNHGWTVGGADIVFHSPGGDVIPPSLDGREVGRGPETESTPVPLQVREVRAQERIAAALEELATTSKQVHGDLSRLASIAADITGWVKRPRKKNPR